ncbi:MAG: hypothetical protein JNM13_15685 [Hyphomicrobiaceae bacterium]|nr:hypothetical protein [Hyphomicrobiaceae bacterium]
MASFLAALRLVWGVIRAAIAGAAYTQGRAEGAAQAGSTRDLEEARRRAEGAESAMEVQDGYLADMARRPRDGDADRRAVTGSLRDGSFGA